MKLMKRLRPHIRRLEAYAHTRHDTDIGLMYQVCLGHRVYLKGLKDYLSPKLLNWLCTEIYFKHYRPTAQDTVVDIGAGLGHEAVWLGQTSGTSKYIAVEIQPIVYECLSNTLHRAGFGHQAISSAISGSREDLFIQSGSDYQTKTTVENNGYIRTPTMRWRELLDKFGTRTVDLLKINIEGGEKFLLPDIDDYSVVRRIVVSAHDFRANAGDGEHFRTREFVRQFLLDKGYKITPVGTGWLGDWLFAEQR